MRRRDFITLLGSATAAWPVAVNAQQPERLLRIGVLMNRAADNPEGQDRLAAFQQGLQELGWTIGRNVQIEYRWDLDEADFRRNAAELVARAGRDPNHRRYQHGSASAGNPHGAYRVRAGYRPGRRRLCREPGPAGRQRHRVHSVRIRHEREMAGAAEGDRIRHQASGGARDAALALGMGQLGAIQSVAPSFGVELRPVGVADANEIERGITAFARDPNGALILTVGPGAIRHREIIIGLAARHKLPAVYPYRFFAADGGLIAYGPDTIEPYRRAAGYVDRILRGEKPADLPVQAPTRYELAINLMTAKALSLEVPPMLLARADEVIE